MKESVKFCKTNMTNWRVPQPHLSSLKRKKVPLKLSKLVENVVAISWACPLNSYLLPSQLTLFGKTVISTLDSIIRSSAAKTTGKNLVLAVKSLDTHSLLYAFHYLSYLSCTWQALKLSSLKYSLLRIVMLSKQPTAVCLKNMLIMTTFLWHTLKIWQVAVA